MGKSYGELWTGDKLVFRIAAGHANDSETGEPVYEMSNLPSGCMMVRSEKTGAWFHLPWADLIGMAEQAGILDPRNAKAETALTPTPNPLP